MIGDGSNFWNEIPAPVIVAPAGGLLGILPALALTLNVQPFVSNQPGLSLGSVEFEIRTAPDGGGSLVRTVTGLLSAVLPALTLGLGQTYYVRARFKSGALASMWSADVRLAT